MGVGTDNGCMSIGPAPETPPTAASGNHFSCSMSAVLLARVHDHGGDIAVADVLRVARSPRTAAYLTDITNWISFDEGVALWRAGAQVTHHPQFARSIGEDAARRLNASPVAALLRSLGSPEVVYEQIATTATKYSTATVLEAVACGPRLCGDRGGARGRASPVTPTTVLGPAACCRSPPSCSGCRPRPSTTSAAPPTARPPASTA